MFKETFAAVGTVGLAVYMISCYNSKKQIEALGTKVGELTTQIRKVEEISFALQQRTRELSTTLYSEVSANKTLWDQVVNLTNELQNERKRSKQLKEHYENESSVRAQLEVQLQETERQLVKQRRKKELLGQQWNQAKREFEDLKFAYDELQMEYNALKQK